MGLIDEFDWASASVQEQMRHVRAATTAQLSMIMREYDWSQFPESILGWVSAQKGIGLNSAISAFFNGDPRRFNYLPKRDVNGDYRGVASLLDAICLRINAGFYLPDPVPLCAQDMSKLDAWIANQRRDLREHRCGRWVIEPDVLDPMFASKRRALEEELRRETERDAGDGDAQARKGPLLKKLVGPLAR